MKLRNIHVKGFSCFCRIRKRALESRFTTDGQYDLTFRGIVGSYRGFSALKVTKAKVAADK